MSDITFFYPPTFSRLFGEGDAPATFASMLNIYGRHFTEKGDDTTTMGVINAALILQKMNIILTIEDGYQANEVLVLTLEYVETDGSLVQVAAGQLDSTITPDPGTYTDQRDVPDIPPGRVLRLVRDYQPGPGPKSEHMTLVLQLF